jgi:hypothetical protein
MLAISDDRASRWDKRRLNRQDLKGSYNHNEYGDEDSDADDIQRFVHDFDELTAPLEVMCMYVCVFLRGDVYVCMCVYLYVYIYIIYIHTYVCTHIRMYIPKFIHTHTLTHIHIYVYIFSYIRSMYIHIYTYIHIYVYAYVYVCVFICMYIYTYTYIYITYICMYRIWMSYHFSATPSIIFRNLTPRCQRSYKMD